MLSVPPCTYSCIMDKGTLDAISCGGEVRSVVVYVPMECVLYHVSYCLISRTVVGRSRGRDRGRSSVRDRDRERLAVIKKSYSIYNLSIAWIT
jgi:hypothetical protein